MKVLFFLLFIIGSFSSFSQSPAYNGPAKKYYDDFWVIINDIKANTKPGEAYSMNKYLSAKSKLSTTKIKDKNLDVSAMEDELKKLDDLLAELNKGNREKYKAAVNEQMFLDNLLKSNAPLVKGTGKRENDIAVFKDEIKNLKASVGEYLSGNPDKSKFAARETTVKTKAATVKDLIERYTSIFSKAQNDDGLYSYFNLIGLQTYWNSMLLFFPSGSEVLNANKLVNEAVIKAGTEEQALAKFKANKAEALKNAKMPIALVKDETLEKIFSNLFNGFQSRFGFTAAKVHIMESDWVITRNSLTGIILDRTKRAVIAAKKSDGTCWIFNVWIAQDYTGSSYGNSHYSGENIISETLCSNIQ